MVRRTFVILMVLFCVLQGCGDRKELHDDSADFPVIREFNDETGLVKVRVKISEPEITVADLLRFVLEVEQKDGAKAILPETGDMDFGKFTVHNVRRMPEKIKTDGTIITGVSYILEPELSGEYIIPPLSIEYSRKDSGVETVSGIITTDSFTVNVVSLGAQESPSATIKPIEGPVSLPAESIPVRWIVLAVVAGMAVIVVITALILSRRKHRTPAVQPKIPAHIIAFNALKKLREKRLIEQGFIKEFYYEISDILRHYIENRFGLSAPEQTTEEFLQAISLNGVFDGRTRNILRDFLQHCDLVKYARYAPETAEIDDAFRITGNFIEETKEVSEHGVQ